MKTVFLSEAETGEKFQCALCGNTVEEIYCLEPETEEEYEILKQKFGDPINWSVGECCFGGYCENPTAFFNEVIKKNL